ncbi:WD repeat-containing protein 64-like [Leucoraja erinacea]|uniref:WD repeat-containing protein 64-like n=1 Tax=Leucoraja erinaceus TaxID=7782 RepID=UPI0024553F74|nr:WD repeat-containing protein 64-like [Leucoraja erinacea]
MSTETLVSNSGLDLPYVLPTFRERVNKYRSMVGKMLQNMNDSENYKKMADADPMTYDVFYDTVQDLFIGELKTESIKTVFKKINNNLDSHVDWTELFGYFPSLGQDIMREAPIFMLSRRQCIEQREEERRHHDHLQCIISVPQVDQVIAATHKGAVLVYNSRVSLRATFVSVIILVIESYSVETGPSAQLASTNPQALSTLVPLARICPIFPSKLVLSMYLSNCFLNVVIVPASTTSSSSSSHTSIWC